MPLLCLRAGMCTEKCLCHVRALIMPLFLKLRSNYIGHDIIAVDLALQRAAPLEIGEYYGKYNVVVERILEDAQNIVLYRNEQVYFLTLPLLFSVRIAVKSFNNQLAAIKMINYTGSVKYNLKPTQ